MNKSILIRYGEIHLKGNNRPFFEQRLMQNIKAALNDFENIHLVKGQGRFYLEGSVDDPRIISRLTQVFGIFSISPAYKVEKDMESIQSFAEQVMRDALSDLKTSNKITFKVESRRSDKKFPLDSMTLSRELGGFLLGKFPNLEVDVHKPDITLYVEVREFVYIYHKIIPGAGGMPVGTNGKALLLLSGGIDSPVAGWMIAKRGVELSAVHYHSFPYTSDRAKEKVIDLCKILARYAGSIKLYVVPFTEIQQAIYEKCPESQLTIIMRRFMMMIAERIAELDGAKALITGESLGQVASQTLDSLVVTNDVVSIPVFRPLIGLDKIEIIDIAHRIETYETSILPYEDCCTVFLPRHPVTHPRLEKVREAEQALDVEDLIHRAIENVEIIEL